MTLVAADFETGVNGNSVQVADTGSPTAWQNVTRSGSATIKYNNTHVAHGSLACAYTAVTASSHWTEWDGAVGTPTDWYGRVYMYLPSIPGTAGPTFMQALGPTSAVACVLHINQITGVISVSYNSGSNNMAVQVATAQWIRVEWHVTHSATVGQVEVKLFNSAESTTASETFTSTANKNTLANLIATRFGQVASADVGFALWLDNVVAGASSYPGAFPVNSVAPTVSGLTTVGSTLTVAGGTWNGTFTKTYQWTRDGSNIAAATATTYVTQSADIGHAVGCTETSTGQVATSETASQASSNTISVAAAGTNIFRMLLGVGS